MLVEDDPLISRMYEQALSEAGFDVMTASDGTFVYETIRINLPDLIIMDIMMPNFNGLDTIQELRNGVLTNRLPILVLSAYDDPAIVKKAYDLGITKYLLKPTTEPAQLVALIKETLGIGEQPQSDQAS